MENIQDKINAILRQGFGERNLYETQSKLLLDLFSQQKQETIHEIDKVYNKEQGIHNWLNLRDRLLKQKLY